MKSLLLLLVCVLMPNTRTAVDNGQIGSVDVTLLAYYQTPTGTEQGLVPVKHNGNGTVTIDNTGNGPGGVAPNVALLEVGDILTPDTLDDYQWLLHYTAEPFVTTSTIDSADMYIGLFAPDGSHYAWIQLRYLGGVEFEQVSSAVAYAGEALTAGYSYGDFDRNGATNGRDFLLWQRNTAIGDLQEYHDNYGAPPYAVQAAITVPEPSTLKVVVPAVAVSIAALLLFLRHRQSNR